MAADILRPVYDQTEGADGFVSIEVSPRLAYDTAASIAEAQRLWKAVNRPNLMVKIPSTVAGIQAVEVLIAEGININITLMFSLAHYEAVAQAFQKSIAPQKFRPPGRNRTHEPSCNHNRPRGRCFCGTFSPSRRQIRCTRSFPTGHPAFCSSAVMRR